MNRKFREYLIPTILTNAAVSMTTVMDSIVVGNLLGEAALSATGFALPILFGINAILFLFTVGGVTLASIARGRHDEKYANRVFTITFTAGMAAMVLLLAVLLIFMEPITNSLAQGDAELAAMTRVYLTPTVFVGPVMMLVMGMAFFVRSDGKPRMASLIAVTANVVNIASDYTLIRFAGMGIEGAGLGTLIGYTAGIFVVIPYLFSKERGFKFAKLRLDDFKELASIAGTGSPKAMTHGLSFARTIILNALIISALGVSGVAAMTVCVRMLTISAIFVVGTNDTLLPIVGTLFGEKDYTGIRFAAHRGFLFMMVTCAAVTVLFMAIPEHLGHLFGINSAEGLAVAVPALRMYAISIPLHGITLMLQNFYPTTGRTKLAALMAALSGFVFTILFALVIIQIDSSYFWMAFALSEFSTILVVLGIGIYIRRKEKVKGILLLHGNQEDGLSAEFSIPATVEACAKLSEQSMQFCRESNVDDSASMRIGIAVEEMAANTASLGHKKNSGVIDVLIRITDQELILRLRDDGVPFNPMEYQCSDESLATEGIDVVRRLAKDISYARPLGFNVTVVTIPRKELQFT